MSCRSRQANSRPLVKILSRRQHESGSLHPAPFSAPAGLHKLICEVLQTCSAFDSPVFSSFASRVIRGTYMKIWLYRGHDDGRAIAPSVLMIFWLISLICNRSARVHLCPCRRDTNSASAGLR